MRSILCHRWSARKLMLKHSLIRPILKLHIFIICIVIHVFMNAVPGMAQIISDDFHSSTLDSNIWTFVDPLGDATLTMTGTEVSVKVPGGTYHGMGRNAPGGANQSPRLMQAAPDRNFEIEAKFTSGVNEAYQSQGLVVEQDSENYLRLEFFSDGAATTIYASSVVKGSETTKVSTTISSGNTAPLFMRVDRVGHLWTQSYSLDGTTWTNVGTFLQSLAVTAVGAYVGNSGLNQNPAPAYTGDLDYFFNTASPIVPEDGDKEGTVDSTNLSSIISDDFHTETLDSSIWTFVDPLEDSTLRMTGTEIAVVVPGGVSHGMGRNAPGGANHSPRLMQAASNTDFEIEAKFTTGVNKDYRTQGLVVEQDSETYLRLEFLSDGAATKIYASSVVKGKTSTKIFATIGNGSPAPLFMRVKRIEHLWMQSYSTDGMTWIVAGTFSQKLVVSAVGPYVGNVGSTESNAPAHTGHIDYFFNTASPIVPEDGDEENTLISTKLSSIISDDFHTVTLDSSVWTFVDPLGDTSLTMTGTEIAVAVPGGATHGMGGNAPDGVNNSPRLMQEASNTDFEIEAKFTTEVSKAYQSQGLVVEQDSRTYLRLEFLSDGAATKIYASSVVEGKESTKISTTIDSWSLVPLFMRVNRIGNLWTQSYSTDGSTWTVAGTFTQSLAVTAVGAYVGNVGLKGNPAPAHTGRIDYFFNTASPIVSDDGDEKNTWWDFFNSLLSKLYNWINRILY